MSKSEKDIDAYSGTETTGHEWDGIKELNTPLPRWWLYIWYGTIAISVVYMIFFPALPALPGMGTNTTGVGGFSDRAAVARDVEALKAARSGAADKLLTASLEEIENDRQLQQFAMAAGESAFGDNCAVCHGVNGRGNVGYPSLQDDVWLWDGSLEGIEYTLLHGIRHPGKPETRFSIMPSFGADGLLTEAQIEDTTQYVLSLSGKDADASAAARGAEIYASQCASCHADDGTGMRELGAPDLTDAETLFGDDAETIYNTIYYARNSHMPAWEDRLDHPTIKALAVYVHTLGADE